MAQEQAEERSELEKMRAEMGDIKSTINDSMHQLNQVSTQANSNNNVNEVHLFVKECTWEPLPGTAISCLSYNGKIPGPEIHARAGEPLRVVVHNQLTTPTSLLIHGLRAPQTVSGLPRKGAGLIEPGQTFTYQLIPKQAGTFCYYPQVNHLEQRSRGLFGVVVVEPQAGAKSFDKELTLVISDLLVGPASGGHDTTHNALRAYSQTQSGQGGARLYYLVNGKSAPAIPPIQVRRGERLRIHLVNGGQHVVPISLSGHHFEVVGLNGSDALEPHLFRDQLTLAPSDRYDVELSCDNPGVWSLASEVAEQATNNGRFPGGIACVFRYIEAIQNGDNADQ